MKLICLLVVMLFYSVTFAQQPPKGPSLQPPEQSPSRQSREPRQSDTSQEIKELMRAQTEAIQALSNKVNTLDERLRKIESKTP